MNGTVREKSLDASGETGEDAPQPLERVLARALGGQIARPCRERAIDRIIDDEPAVDHVREAVAQPLLAQLGKQQPHVVVGPRQTAADVERAIQRLLHQARHLRLVRHLEAGIEIRLERKLAKQRQAERVDRADGDVARALAHVAPQFLIRSRRLGARAQLVENAAPHLGGGLARKRDGEDVRRLDAAAQQVEIPIDEHMGLAGACRRLEHDVVRGIDRPRSRCRIGRESRVDSPDVDAGLWTLGSGLSSNGSQLDVANVILPADGGVRAAGAHHRVGGRRRKFSTLDSVDRIEQARLRVDEHGVLALAARQHRDELPILAKSDIAGLARFPVLSSGLSQVLHGADGVDRQLQRQLAIGCAAQLVIDDAERVVLQQIDAIGFSTQRDAPGLGLCLESRTRR